MSRPRILSAAAALTLAGLLATGTTAAANPALLADPAQSAQSILDDGGTELLNSHVGGDDDPDSTALRNIEDTAGGAPAKTSPWSDVGVTEVDLSANMLDAVNQLGADHEFRITTVAGGDHSSNSYHYAGTAFDLDTLDGEPISSSHPGYQDFLAKCEQLGAVEALGPGDSGHDSHLHCAWPE